MGTNDTVEVRLHWLRLMGLQHFLEEETEFAACAF